MADLHLGLCLIGVFIAGFAMAWIFFWWLLGQHRVIANNLDQSLQEAKETIYRQKAELSARGGVAAPERPYVGQLRIMDDAREAELEERI